MDKLIALPTRKAEVLLAYLALAPGLRHPRERLVNLLWSERGDAQARNSLRQCLSAIRKALGETADLILQVDRTTVSLKSELVEVDAHEFERLTLEGDFESLDTAASLYQGEFLEGISIRDPACQDWLANERVRFRQQLISILTNLAETQLVTHDYVHAIRSAERLVEQDPLAEAGWRLLMRGYFGNGNRSHALKAFKRCEQILRAELDIEPEAETIGLRDRIAGGAIETGPSTGKVTSSSVRAESSDHSIAVLPFDNLSGDPDQEYFSDGITESIILNLALFPDLNIKSRNSSFAFKQQIKSIGEISNALNVDYIVEGSVRRSAGRIRVNVQLIEAKSGNQIWGNRYESVLDDLFRLEEDLSRSIAATVTGRISSELQRIAIDKGASGQEAYDFLLAGTYYTQQFNPEGTRRGIEKLNACLERDPNNVRAHVWLYACHIMSYVERWVEDYRAAFERAEAHIRKAIELEPGNGLVQSMFGEFMAFCGEYEEADKYIDRALAQNPNNVDALVMKAYNLEGQGRIDEARETIRRAIDLDPFHPWAEWELVGTEYLAGNYQAMLDSIEKARTTPAFMQIFGITAKVKLGRIDEARQTLTAFIQECRKDMAAMPQSLDEWHGYIYDNYRYLEDGLYADIIDCLLQAGLMTYLGESPRHISAQAHAIAVLPFDNLSGDPEQEYFSDGISESIILHLSAFPDLKVKSRHSSFAFKQQLKSLGDISEELGVEYLVEGSIRKSGQRVRITVQLIEAFSGNQIWGKRYDSDLDDLFELEEDLSRTIAATVTGQIESELKRIALAKGASDQQTYDLLLSGSYHLNLANRDGLARAIDELNRCVARDPDNVRAHALLYDCYIMSWMDRQVADYEPLFDLAGEHARKAIALDPENVSALSVFGEFMIFNRDYRAAAKYLDKALKINPNEPDTATRKAMNLSMQGRFDEGLRQAIQARDLDPYNWWVDWNLAEAQYLTGRFAEAIETIDNSNNAPGFIRIYSTVCHVKLKQMAKASAALDMYLDTCRASMAAMPQNLDEWYRYTCDTAPFADPAINRDILDCLAQAGLEEKLTGSVAEEIKATEPSVLILPFENISGDPEQQYFSDGITGSIVLGLGLFEGLAVKSHKTSFAYRDSDLSSQEIADRLGVDFLVEGSIRKSGSKVRVSVQLVEAETGRQIWGKQYDAELADILELEQELSRTIAATISGRIGHRLQQSAARKPARDLQSYDYLLRGLYHFGKFTAPDFAIAKTEIENCLEIDPENATAHTNLGVILWIETVEGWCEDVEPALQKARHHLELAVEIDPDYALAHAYYGAFLFSVGEYDKGEFHADKSIELNPTASEGYVVKADLLGASGRIEEAIPYADKSLQLDPYSVGAGWAAGAVYKNAGMFEKAIKTFRSIPHPPVSVHALIAVCFASLGLDQEARKEVKRYQELAKRDMSSYPESKDAWRHLCRKAMPYRNEKDFDAAFDKLIEAGLLEGLTKS